VRVVVEEVQTVQLQEARGAQEVGAQEREVITLAQQAQPTPEVEEAGTNRGRVLDLQVVQESS
jgi:hypothetical protein